MTPTRRNVLIATAAGLIVAGGVTAIAATQFNGPHTAVVIQTAGAGVNGFNGQPGRGGGANGQPSLGGSNGGFNGQPGLGGGANGQPRLGGGGGFGGGFRGFSGGFRGGLFGGIPAAASYLGVTAQELVTDVQSGKTLAQVAKDKGKTAGGLVSAMVTEQKKQLEAAVSAGQFTQQQADLIVSSLTQRYTAIVNGTRPSGRGFGGGFGGGGGSGSFGGSGGSPGGGTSLGGATTPA